MRHLTSIMVLVIFVIVGGPTIFAADKAHAKLLWQRDEAYGPNPLQTLDIFLPDNVTDETPILVFFHGGGFQRGDKNDVVQAGRSFAGQGVILVAPNYRLHPEVAFPEFIHDAAEAVAYALNSLPRSDGAPRKIFVGGWSAGAYIAAMLAFNEAYLADSGVDSRSLAGIAGLAGPYKGGMCYGQRCEALFPEESRQEWTLPPFLDQGDPKALFVIAGKDKWVPRSHLKSIREAADAANLPYSVFVAPEAHHMRLLALLSDEDSEVRKAVDAFISEN